MLPKLIYLILLAHLVASMPPNDKALYQDGPEERRRKRPCRGRSSDGDGRTFLDWSFQYLDINYNYNYNINCGGGGNNKPGLGGGGHNKPHGGGHQPLGGGGGNKPIGDKPGGDNHHGGLFGGNGPLGGGGLFGGNGPFNGGLFGGNGPLGIFSQSQSQSQGNPSDFIGSLLPQGGLFNGGGLGSWLPQGGPFNGQGIGSLFDGGLFSGIFDRPQAPAPAPPPSGGGGSQPINTPKPEVPDPDIIYNDEIPVHEDHDDVVPDTYSNYRPAPYYNGYKENPNGRSNNIRFT